MARYRYRINPASERPDLEVLHSSEMLVARPAGFYWWPLELASDSLGPHLRALGEPRGPYVDAQSALEAGRRAFEEQAQRAAVEAGRRVLEEEAQVAATLEQLDDDDRSVVLILSASPLLPMVDLSGRFRDLGLLGEGGSLSLLGRAVAKAILAEDPEARS